MTVSRVKEFDFGTKKSEGGPVKYKQGGAVRSPGFDSDCILKDTGTLGISGNKNPRGPALAPQKLARGGTVTEKTTGERYPSREAMVRHEAKETPRMQREELVQRAKVTAPARRSVPVAPESPLLAMKKGGAAKVGKVMGEFKAGELHSGSKTGPVVKSRAQAVAIGLSEARKAAKR
jgi:hypothetical protein